MPIVASYRAFTASLSGSYRAAQKDHTFTMGHSLYPTEYTRSAPLFANVSCKNLQGT